MKTAFVFDKETGTMKPTEKESVDVNIKAEGQQAPVFEKAKEVDLSGVNGVNVELNEPVVQFRGQSDYTIMQVVDEHSGTPLMYIGGYALEIKFNMREINSVVKVEQCLEGLKKMFRKFIVDQALGGAQ